MVTEEGSLGGGGRMRVISTLAWVLGVVLLMARVSAEQVPGRGVKADDVSVDGRVMDRKQ